MKSQINTIDQLLRKKNHAEYKDFQNKSKNQNIFTIVSGKGGVGKTSLTVNLAIALKKLGKKVLVFDGDFGMANVHILLGEFPRHNLQNFLNGEKTMQEIIFASQYGIDLIPGISAINEINNLTKYERLKFIKALYQLKHYDYILIDLPSGMSKLIMDFVGLCRKVILVTTPEPTSLADGYSLLKLLIANYKPIAFYTIFNRCFNLTSGEHALGKLKKLATKFLKTDVINLGFALKDDNLLKSIYLKKPILELSQNTLFSKNVINISKTLEEEMRIENLYKNKETILV